MASRNPIQRKPMIQNKIERLMYLAEGMGVAANGSFLKGQFGPETSGLSA